MISLAQKYIKMGQILKTLREKAELSIEALVELTHLSSSTISRIENGKANVNALGFAKVCEVFGVYPENLLDIRTETISVEEMHNRLDKYLLKIEADVTTINRVHACHKRSLTSSYFVTCLIDDGFFNEFKKVSEAREEITITYKTDISSSVLSKLLKLNKRLQSKPAGKSTHKLYKVVKTIRK